MTPRELHAVLQAAFDALAALHCGVPAGISIDTAFAVGVAAGQIAKAKALVGRDIDDLEKRADQPPA